MEIWSKAPGEVAFCCSDAGASRLLTLLRLSWLLRKPTCLCAFHVLAARLCRGIGVALASETEHNNGTEDEGNTLGDTHPPTHPHNDTTSPNHSAASSLSFIPPVIRSFSHILKSSRWQTQHAQTLSSSLNFSENTAMFFCSLFPLKLNAARVKMKGTVWLNHLMNYSSLTDQMQEMYIYESNAYAGKPTLDIHNAQRNGKCMTHDHRLKEKSDFLTFNTPSIHHLM